MKYSLLMLALTFSGSYALGAVNKKCLSPRASMMVRSQGSLVSDMVVPVYLTVEPSCLDRDAFRCLGVNVSVDLGDILTARVPTSSIEALSGIKGVRYIQVSSPVEQTLDIASDEVGMTPVHQATTLSQPYKGTGVVVGIVDSGFDYAHAAYRDSDGDTRIKRVWEQTTAPFDHYTSPSRFGYGVEMIDPSDILAAGADRTNNSHGSHVTSIAAGAVMLDGALTGMAPDADIVLVSMQDAGANNVNVSDAIAYIFDYADAVDKPCVINLSLGSNSGPHDGTSTFDRIADALQGPGRLIVGASGNNRADKFHLRREFLSADADPLQTFIDFTTAQSYKNEGEVEIWADSEIEASLLVYKLSSGDIVESVDIYPEADNEASEVSLGRNISGSFKVASEVSPLNGKHHIALVSKVTSVRTGYAVAIKVSPLSAGAVDIWTDDRFIALSSKGISGFSEPSASDPTLCEIGGTAKRILTVGAYTTRNEYVTLGETAPVKLNETVGDICSFSGAGPTADGRMKPQVTAPGCFISAAVSSYDNSGTIFYSGYNNAFGRDNYYGYMQGTSMATPFVTGIVASWLQAWPEMTPEDLVEVVQVTSRHDIFTGETAGNDWGYGKIDALAGIRECITRSGNQSLGSVISDAEIPFVASCDGVGHLSLLFISGLCDVSMSVYSLMGSQLWHSGIDCVDSGEAMDIDLSAFVTGVYIFNITTSVGNYSLKIKI